MNDMSASSSGSWAGGAADILDLDRFMRGARPGDTRDSRAAHDRPLVVDSGAGRKSSSSGGSHKRYSHDSGLSDGSSRPERRPRAHRRSSCSESRPKELQSKPSSPSMRAFRSACSRALREQQAQLARVAHLCERLAGERLPPGRERRRTPSSTDLSSSSRSTRDLRDKDKHRSDECKTYKIIMTKLDELNRLFSARARPAPPAAAPPPPQSTPTVPPRRAERAGPRLVERAVGDARLDDPRPTCCSTADSAGSRWRRRAVTVAPATHAAGPAPAPATPRGHSPVKCEAGNQSSSSGELCGFDLDNPVRLYAQAKRLQALHVCPHSPRGARAVCGGSSERAAGAGAAGAGGRGSLCALCRSYARALRHYLAAQLLCCPVR